MHNGLHLNSFKHLCDEGNINIMPAPDVLRLSLQQHSDTALHPCVQQGETVAMGQVIAKPDSTLGAWLHAPVSGCIHAINDKSGDRDIVITNDHHDRRAATCIPCPDWQTRSSPELIDHLAEGGIAGLGGAVYSTGAKISAHLKHRIETVIINGMECEPFITCDDHLMREHATSILNGTQILLHASGAQNAIVAIEDDKPAAIHSMRNALQSLDDTRIQVRILPTRYPGGDEGQLTKQLLSREIPRGQLPSAIGVLINNVATAHACAQWILKGEPLISRIVTVTGHGIHQPFNVEIRIGTACKDIIAFCGGYGDDIVTLIMGGSMMGKALRNDNDTISKASNCLIAATDIDISPTYIEQPCIRCAECANACPANLLPQQLLMHLRNHNINAAVELGLRDCIECGCCDAVCPSHIMLASRFRAAKLQLHHQ